jgi:hypothetical protein
MQRSQTCLMCGSLTPQPTAGHRRASGRPRRPNAVYPPATAPAVGCVGGCAACVNAVAPPSMCIAAVSSRPTSSSSSCRAARASPAARAAAATLSAEAARLASAALARLVGGSSRLRGQCACGARRERDFIGSSDPTPGSGPAASARCGCGHAPERQQLPLPTLGGVNVLGRLQVAAHAKRGAWRLSLSLPVVRLAHAGCAAPTGAGRARASGRRAGVQACLQYAGGARGRQATRGSGKHRRRAGGNKRGGERSAGGLAITLTGVSTRADREPCSSAPEEGAARAGSAGWPGRTT